MGNEAKRRKQRGATQEQLGHRRRMLLNAARCIACGRKIGEHTEQSIRDRHRRKQQRRSLLPLAALVMVASVACV